MHHSIIRRTVACLGFAAIVTASAIGCSSDNSSSSSSSSSATSAAMDSGAAAAPGAAGGGANSSDPTVKAITDTFTTFFSPKTSADKKAALLQNGSAFAPALQAQAGNPMAANTSVTVSDVKTTDASHAAVTYTVLMSGNPVLPNQAGQAVLEGGQWKVAAATFCALLSMQGPAPAACPAH